MINSIIDTDLYKLTMQQAVLEKYPEAQVTYEFTSRRSTPVNATFAAELRSQIDKMDGLKLQSYEREYLQSACPFLKRNYLEYLQNYRFNPDQVTTLWDTGNSGEFNLQNLRMPISGSWHETILWEVPLLAIISETYFLTVDKKWNYAGQEELIQRKAGALSISGCKFADFGTRRRRSFRSQQTVVQNLVKYPGCVGTSNVWLAMMHNTKPIGTMAHEWIMGISALESLRHANRYALNIWNDVYHGDLGIALSDTFGSDAFFEDFDGILARLFDGVRHDSGCPFKFTDKVVVAYQKLGISPATKTIVFSDSLDVKLCLELRIYCEKLGINCSFGIGTHLTNDYENSPALNIVIKLRSIARALNLPFTQVVKLSDVLTKATGDRDALRVAKWIFFGSPLDEQSA